jgi:hypothetical protein
MAQLSKKPVLERRLGCANCLSIDRTNYKCPTCREQITLYEIQSATPVVSKKWNCSFCTYENPAAQNTCGMCRNKRPEPMPEKTVVTSAPLASKKPTPERSSAPPKQTPEILAAAAVVSKPNPDEWVCDKCTLINKKENVNCKACNKINPLGVQKQSNPQKTVYAAAAAASDSDNWKCICEASYSSHMKKCYPCDLTKDQVAKIKELEQPEKWICYYCGKENNTLSVEKCKVTKSCQQKVKVKKIDDNVFFQPQSGSMSCLREAINNVEQDVSVVNSGATFTEQNLGIEVFPLNIKEFCDVIVEKVEERALLEDKLNGTIICDDNENYEYSFLAKILSYLKYVLIENYGTNGDLIKKKITKDFNEGEFNEDNVLFINLGKETESGNIGRHWVSARYIKDKWYYFDGKAKTPQKFNTKKELVNYIKNNPEYTVYSKPINITIYEKHGIFIPNDSFVTAPIALSDLIKEGGSRYNHNKQLYKLLKNMI